MSAPLPLLTAIVLAGAGLATLSNDDIWDYQKGDKLMEEICDCSECKKPTSHSKDIDGFWRCRNCQNLWDEEGIDE